MLGFEKRKSNSISDFGKSSVIWQDAGQRNQSKGADMKKGAKLVIVGCSGAGGPAAMLSKKLMPEIDITLIRKEEFFIVR